MTANSPIAPARLARRPVLATQADARLVDLVRAGYEPAFETIVSRYPGSGTDRHHPLDGNAGALRQLGVHPDLRAQVAQGVA